MLELRAERGGWGRGPPEIGLLRLRPSRLLSAGSSWASRPLSRSPPAPLDSPSRPRASSTLFDALREKTGAPDVFSICLDEEVGALVLGGAVRPGLHLEWVTYSGADLYTVPLWSGLELELGLGLWLGLGLGVS